MTGTTTAAGLELAKELLNDDRVAFVQCHIVPEAGLSAGDQAIADDYTAAIAAVTGAAAELQRLSAERDELAARLAEIERQAPVAWVPIHPRTGPLWSMTTGSPDEERLPHYPLKPLYTRTRQTPGSSRFRPCG